MTGQVKKKVDFSGLKKFFVNLFGSEKGKKYKMMDDFLNLLVPASKLVVDILVPVEDFYLLEDRNHFLEVSSVEGCQLIGIEDGYASVSAILNGEPVRLGISVLNLRQLVIHQKVVVKKIVK